jgi:hypothetical protein
VETGLAYFGESTSPLLKSLRTFLSETFEPLSAGQAVPGNSHQLFLF